MVFEMKKDLSKNHADIFEQYNIQKEVAPIYKIPKSSIKANNIILCFIILAYDNESKWLEIHKDRYQNKLKIMTDLGGDVKKSPYKEVVTGNSRPVQEVLLWFLTSIIDWRWNSIFTYFDAHSQMMLQAGAKTIEEFTTKDEKGNNKITNVDVKELIETNIKKTQLITKAHEMRQAGEAMLRDIQKELVNVDTVLNKEGRMSLSSTADYLKWEHFVADIRKPDMI